MTRRATLQKDWARAAKNAPRLTVSQWADAKRFLPETSGAKGARWQTDQTPYLRGIMNAVHEPGVRTIALRKCAQVGGSEGLHNILGYFIEHDPCPMLFVHPTVEVAEEWSKDRLADMLRTTPALRAVVRDKRGKDAESTLKLKVFPGGFLALGGANTPNTFARRAVRVAFGDDVDRWPAVVGEEGDPADLLGNRTTTFDDPLVMFVSTPTLKGGRIDTLYERSDQRRYVVTCPGCGRVDWITWSDGAHFHVVYQDADAETARLACPSPDHGGCGSAWPEHTRRVMVAGGAWRATATAKQAGLVGFHLPAMIATLGVTLVQLVEKWLSARARGRESLRVFINTSLGEGWEDRGARMDPHGLIARLESYGDGIEVPERAVAITAGVDVQADRFELGVMAWGPAAERWVIDHRTVDGNPKDPAVRAQLLEALQRKYAHASGALLPIHATCIDTGYATDEIYDFVLANQVRRIFGTKGIGGRTGEPIVGKPTDRRTGKNPRPIRLYPINVDDAKADVMNSLALIEPGPGAIHFPRHLDTMTEEYFAQLCAEHRETRYNKAGVATHSVWVLDRERNEALDLAVLCLAAYRLFNPNIRQMLEALGIHVQRTAAAPSATGGSNTPAAVPPAKPRERRVSRSDYLQR